MPEREPLDDFHLDLEGAEANCDFFTDVVPVGFEVLLSGSSFLCEFGQHHATTLMDFFFDLEMHADFVISVTYLELFLAYVKFSGTTLPVQVSESGATVWRDLSTYRAGDLLGVTLSSQLKTFQLLVDTVLDCVGVEVDGCLVDRPESGLLKPLPALRAPWPHEVALETHFTLASFTKRRPIRTSADLARPWR